MAKTIDIPINSCKFGLSAPNFDVPMRKIFWKDQQLVFAQVVKVQAYGKT